MKRKMFIILFALTLIILPASGLIKAQNKRPTLPYRFLIPEGYVGWVRVDFDVSDAPELPIEDGYYIFKFPGSGRLQTSSSDIVDSRHNQFFYYASDETKYQLEISSSRSNCMVAQQLSGPWPNAPAPFPYRYIFIGPKDVFATYQTSNKRLLPKEPDGLPKVGAQTWLTPQDLIRMTVRQP